MSEANERDDKDFGSRHCSNDPVATNEDIDGIYRYRWTTRFGRHTVFYDVKGGVIQENIANQSSPIREFVGRNISEFAQARLMKDWRFTDDSLHQMKQAESR